MENKIISKIRQTKISQRLIISFLILSILPTLIIFLAVNTTIINLIKEDIISNDKVTSNLVSRSISSYINKFDSITNDIIWNNTLLNNIQSYNTLTNKEKENFKEKLAKIIRSRTTYMSDIADFTILDKDLNIVYNEGVRYISKDIKLEEIASGLRENKIINWTSVKQGNNNYIIMTKPIRFAESTYGYLFLAIKEKVIIDMFSEYNENLSGFAVILDENNDIVTSNIKDNNLIINKEDINKAQVVKNIDNTTKIVNHNGNKYIATSRTISYTNWKIISIVPYSYIYSNCINIYKTYAIVSILVISVSMIVAYIIHKSIIKPISSILKAMNSVNEESLGDEIEISGNDEITIIMKKYNIMHKNIKSLLHTVKLRETEKREITLRMLQAQINPHFLFNTLGSLRYVAMINNDNIVANGLEALAKLLRSTIVNKDEFISIKDEIENVKNYITINKIRYGDTYNIYYNIDEKLYNEKILKFILQPLIENSILHGFEESNEFNEINIDIYDNGEFINFEIIDNGIGIEEDKLEMGSFNIDKFAGIGVKNVRERLSLYYEGVFTFEITSKANEGTITKIVIPKIIGG